MFDPKSSFTDEITNDKEAKQAVDYFSKNEIGWRNELTSEGVDYDKIQEDAKQLWTNLVNSCNRVGFSDYRTQTKCRQYNIK